MKIPLLCNTCVDQNMMASHSYLLTEPRADGIYTTECTNGHRVTRLIDEEHFQVLFEYATCALRDGYYREAVTSFAAALERFYEYAIKLILHSSQTNIDDTSKAWKLVKKSSERQLGAFIFLYLQTMGKPPTVLTDDESRFRNGVVHEGKFPSLDETVGFGNSVQKAIYSNYESLQEKIGNAVHSQKCERQRNFIEHIGPDVKPVYFGIAMTLDLRTNARPSIIRD